MQVKPLTVARQRCMSHMKLFLRVMSCLSGVDTVWGLLNDTSSELLNLTI